MSGASRVPAHLASLASSLTSRSLRELFASDASRVAELSRSIHFDDGELLVDFSKQLVTAEVLGRLVDLADEYGVFETRRRMIAGQAVNSTEDRAVTHVAMRARDDVTAPAALRAVAQGHLREVRSTIEGTPGSITHVVNLGIGGSDLGPALLCDAISAIRPAARSVRFASNVDPLDLDRALAGLDPRRTMFVVCSKSFGTVETTANAKRAVEWLAAAGVADVTDHLVAVTSQPDRARASGLPIGRVLGLPSSIGGRFSVSSSTSLTVALAHGTQVLDEVRDGMRIVDEHFVLEAPTSNVPLLVGLVWWWNSAVLGHPSVAVVPYSSALALLPAYLQQLVMESNGKRVDHDGRPVASSSPVVWGGVGTNAQHAFFQLLHQGTGVVPCDFVGFSAPVGSSSRDHDVLVANMFAQSAALAFGVTEGEVGGDERLRAHRATPGSRPSTTMLFSRLTPRALGALIAIYEHATMVQGAMYGVNSFDQWGVELGKQLANRVLEDIDGTAARAPDPSTAALVEHHLRWRNRR